MAEGPEISMRIDFFRDVDATVSVEKATSGREYAGSMLIDGVRPLQVPRVGEFILGLSGYLPFPFALVTAVEHRIAGIGGTTKGDPSLTVVITAPWPGDGIKDRVVTLFENQGWRWYEAQGERLREEALRMQAQSEDD